MLTKGLRDEENERINNILKQLISLVYVPENWNLDELEKHLNYLALTLEKLLGFSSDELIDHLEKLHFDWANAEQFADFIVLLSDRKEEERTQITWEISTGFQQICKYSINSQSYLHAWHYYNSAI